MRRKYRATAFAVGQELLRNERLLEPVAGEQFIDLPQGRADQPFPKMRACDAADQISLHGKK